MKYFVFDTETTGLGSSSEIVQLSYCIIENGTVLKAKNFFFMPDGEIESEAEKVHGLSLDKLEDLGAEEFCHSANEIWKDVSMCHVLVAHNLNFDKARLNYELTCFNEDFFLGDCAFDQFCSMMEYTNILKIKNPYGYDNYKWPKLEEVVSYLQIEKQKILDLAKELFGESCDYHDSRFDLAATILIAGELESGLKLKKAESPSTGNICKNCLNFEICRYASVLSEINKRAGKVLEDVNEKVFDASFQINCKFYRKGE